MLTIVKLFNKKYKLLTKTMGNSHHSQEVENDLSTFELIALFVVFCVILIWLGDTFTATVGIILEGLVFAVAYNSKNNQID